MRPILYILILSFGLDLLIQGTSRLGVVWANLPYIHSTRVAELKLFTQTPGVICLDLRREKIPLVRQVNADPKTFFKIAQSGPVRIVVLLVDPNPKLAIQEIQAIQPILQRQGIFALRTLSLWIK